MLAKPLFQRAGGEVSITAGRGGGMVPILAVIAVKMFFNKKKIEPTEHANHCTLSRTD
jgi:hypothetical protein